MKSSSVLANNEIQQNNAATEVKIAKYINYGDCEAW